MIGPQLGETLPIFEQCGCIYLDYNATTPIWPEVAAEMQPFLTEFGNPSSTHIYGQKTAAAIQLARQRVAKVINAQPNEIYFTGCGTESNNWACWGAIASYRRSNPSATKPPHIITSCIEHPAILEHLDMLKSLNFIDYTAVDVDEWGIVKVDHVVDAITDETCLVTIMHSNNETGAIQPIKEISNIIKSKSSTILFHTDAAQSIGKIPVDTRDVGVDMMSVVGHKFGAPKGIAALYIRDGVQIDRFLCGGGQEGGRRAGTESVLLISGLGKAAEIAALDVDRTALHMKTLRDALENKLIQGAKELGIPVRVNGHPDKRLPNTTSISFHNVHSGTILKSLSTKLAASSGSACHSSSVSSPEDCRLPRGVASSVLWAMGLDPHWAQGTFRLSVGRHSTMDDVSRGAQLILEELQKYV